MRQAWRRLRRTPTGLAGLVLVGSVLLMALGGPWMLRGTLPGMLPAGSRDSSASPLIMANQAPDRAHPLGTDRLGDDVAARVVAGAPAALAVGLGAAAVAGLIGIAVGGIAGYVGGWIDELLMRLTELFLVIPVFLVILAAVRLFGLGAGGRVAGWLPHGDLLVVVVLLGGFGWPPLARLTRAEFRRLRVAGFVDAARVIGAHPADIVWRHMLPNALPAIAAAAALGIGGAVLAEAMIGFLGFGDPAAASWGQMLFVNHQLLRVAPWSSLAPAGAIFVTVLGFNLLADGLSHAFDPRADR